MRFRLKVFYESAPQAPEYPIIQNYSKVLKFSEIFAAQGAPQVANGKFFNQKSFNCFVWTPLISRVVPLTLALLNLPKV